MTGKDGFDAVAYALAHNTMKKRRYTYELYVEGTKVMDNIDPKYVPFVVEPFIRAGFNDIYLQHYVEYTDVKSADDMFYDPHCYKVKEVENKIKKRK